MRLRRAGARVAGFLAALALVAGVAWMAGGVPPYGPIAGGRLRGERAGELPPDWSFVDRIAEVEVETHLGPLPWSVTTWCLSHERALYLPSRNCFDKRWVKNVQADPDVRVRIAGRLYDLRLREEKDPLVNQALVEQMLIKYLGIEAEQPRAALGAGPELDARAYACVFRAEPRP